MFIHIYSVFFRNHIIELYHEIMYNLWNNYISNKYQYNKFIFKEIKTMCIQLILKG